MKFLIPFRPIAANLTAIMLFSQPLHADDLSGGAYGLVFARRLMSTFDKDANGSLQKAELGPQWRLYGPADKNTDSSLNLAELSKAAIPHLQSRGRQMLNILYKKTAEEDQYLDLYYPEKRGPGKLPLVIYTHGGGWTTGSKQNIAFTSFPKVYLSLLDKGFAVAAVNYRLWKLGGNVTMRDCVTDAKDAVRYLAKHGTELDLDPMRCFVHGDSAGGHIAQMLLLTSPGSLPGDPALVGATYRMIAGVSWYGPCDFEKPELFDPTGKGDTRDRFGPRILKPGTDPRDKTRLYREMSPVQYLDKDSPPLLMIQGDKDDTIPVAHAHHMVQMAKAAHAPAEAMIIKNAGHNWREAGGTIEPGIDAIVESTVNFLAHHLKETH